MANRIDSFRKFFTQGNFWAKLRRFATSVGSRGLYTALLLYFAYQRKDTPSWAKRIVLGTLGYLVAPFDALPDLSPFIGFTDDIGVLSFGLVTIAAYVNDEVKSKARGQMTKMFGGIKEEDIAAVEEKL